ncbi:DUF1643 domain-containing protein [Mesorhizobium sp. B1-1-7]|uniref:DUF1643 domain-containing protein n=1 Tax=Mesorhizobium sp. B1-1-7 TaxID=2589977 RepID=UPI001129D0FF|nr:DUF1643 domain-containing protein [Mesorhizobium sp. B1-1-7]TPN44894.1 DUF1643 domain-containing protein [Mesorhizobium sp. B1-1-7]
MTLAERIAADPYEGAWMSDEEDPVYRMALWRIWDRGKPLLLVGMLNPSTAGRRKNDPTINRLFHFARANGFGGFIVVNAYAFRASHPQVMFAAADPIGPLNRAAIDEACRLCATALLAYGAGASEGGHRLWLQISSRIDNVVCLGTSQDGSPKHPMARGKHRIPDDARFQPFQYRGAA